MEFIDANYILRYLLRDNQKQFLLAKDTIENHDISLLDFILAEVVYVLEKVYAVPRTEIKSTLETLIQYPNITLTDKAICLESLQIDVRYEMLDMRYEIRLSHDPTVRRFESTNEIASSSTPLNDDNGC